MVYPCDKEGCCQEGRMSMKGTINADLNRAGEQRFSAKAMAYAPKPTLKELVSTNTPTV